MLFISLIASVFLHTVDHLILSCFVQLMMCCLLHYEGAISINRGNVRYKYRLHIYIVCSLSSPRSVRGMCNVTTENEQPSNENFKLLH